MKDRIVAKQHVIKLTGYILFILIVFTLSLFAMSFELFFLTAVIILITLRSIEKELRIISKKTNHQ